MGSQIVQKHLIRILHNVSSTAKMSDVQKHLGFFSQIVWTWLVDLNIPAHDDMIQAIASGHRLWNRSQRKMKKWNVWGECLESVHAVKISVNQVTRKRIWWYRDISQNHASSKFGRSCGIPIKETYQSTKVQNQNNKSTGDQKYKSTKSKVQKYNLLNSCSVPSLWVLLVRHFGSNQHSRTQRLYQSHLCVTGTWNHCLLSS